MTICTNSPIVLASTSTIRRALLTDAGICFTTTAPHFDEDAMKPRIAHLPPLEQAQQLASGKALSVVTQQSDAFVIGADQVCSLETHTLSKPGGHERAIAQLTMMRGKAHSQNCACVIAHRGEIIWQHAEAAHLTMRNLSDQEVADYVTLDAPFSACGSYKFESYGKHLFSQVEGNYDTIKGLPIVPLLHQLYTLGVLSLRGSHHKLKR